jgi:hypothetical protein
VIEVIGFASFGEKIGKADIMYETNLPVQTFCGTCDDETTMSPDSLKIKSFDNYKDINLIELSGKCNECSNSITITQSYKAK